MSRDIERNIINYRYCKYLIDEACCNGDSEYCAEFPPTSICEINSHDQCDWFEKEDGKQYGSGKEVTDDEFIIMTLI